MRAVLAVRHSGVANVPPSRRPRSLPRRESDGDRLRDFDGFDEVPETGVWGGGADDAAAGAVVDAQSADFARYVAAAKTLFDNLPIVAAGATAAAADREDAATPGSSTGFGGEAYVGGAFVRDDDDGAYELE